MKISELIEKLEKIKEGKGDCKVCIPSGDMDYQYTKIDDVFFSDGEHLLIGGHGRYFKDVVIITDYND